MSFELTFLGTSGGPLEGNTCSILLKSADISYETILDLNIEEDNSLSVRSNSQDESRKNSATSNVSTTSTTSTTSTKSTKSTTSLTNLDPSLRSYKLDELICVDAGSGMGKLTEIILQESKLQKSNCNLLDYYSDSESINFYYHPSIQITTPFIHFKQPNTIMYTKSIFQRLSNFLISHPHLDHVSSLVINSAGFATNNPPKQVWGSKYTINSLQNHYFNGVVWPNMPSFDILRLNQMKYKQSNNVGRFKVKMFPLSHGELNIITKKEKNGGKENELSLEITGNRRHSSITTIPPGVNDDEYIKTKLSSKLGGSSSTNTLSSLNMQPLESYPASPTNTTNPTKPPVSDSVLEPASMATTLQNTSSQPTNGSKSNSNDSVSHLNYNLTIWKEAAAPLIISGRLRAIVVECSNSFEIDENKLYGHLTPRHVVNELKVLERECRLLLAERSQGSPPSEVREPEIFVTENKKESDFEKSFKSTTRNLDQPLRGLNIIINHVKEPLLSNYRQIRDPRKQILLELNKLNEEEKLGVYFSVALSGTSIII
ncbi:3',5'-cyclic-nucleotide phosphodiesterase pde1 [Lodderomyces elongisporus]|uniref:3',5'-cyclic-nucleotide phosphodiesterase pde1 n=1 Tax=Lodderomyces elongisporus TaxID=36914 RepID=UPI0029249840|nr:3',5'-cyclic-nucleotide phosphodiesterase pde1 [Lodderomyces elongisporus]WLF81130.1 3',5'-cyclic-nucleotide phosphodiesterase pde1 [Lodderomyces elongisporus]